MDSAWPRKNIGEIYTYYQESEEALRSIFSIGTPFYKKNLSGLRTEEIRIRLDERLLDLQMNCAFFALAEIEAIFKKDYLNRSIRAKRPKSDEFSKHMRKIYRRKLEIVSLEDDILASWKVFYPDLSNIISELKGALNLRNWLAHGRYWKEKFGRKYDYTYVRIIADIILKSFPFIE